MNIFYFKSVRNAAAVRCSPRLKFGTVCLLSIQQYSYSRGDDVAKFDMVF